MRFADLHFHTSHNWARVVTGVAPAGLIAGVYATLMVTILADSSFVLYEMRNRMSGRTLNQKQDALVYIPPPQNVLSATGATSF